MPDKYIVNMTAKTTPEDTNLLVIEDAADTKKITWANLFKPIKNMIGNLASLKTTHKSTIVGATNEIKDQIDAVEANRSLPQQAVTWQSDDRVWHEKGPGLFYVGSNGIALGYPQNFGIILSGGSTSVCAQIFASTGVVAVRRFNTTQAMDWAIK